MSTGLGKPHIKKVRYRWHCTDGFHSGWGLTARASYYNWRGNKYYEAV